jgi:hypothetical protein
VPFYAPQVLVTVGLGEVAFHTSDTIMRVRFRHEGIHEYLEARYIAVGTG